MYGEIVYKDKEISACCARPNFADCFIVSGIKYPAVICKNCGEVTMLPTNRIYEWIFNNIFALFWNGSVFVPDGQISPEEWKRIESFV